MTRKDRADRRAQGLRPMEIGVPDSSAPGSAEEIARQCRLIAGSPQDADDQAFIDSVSWFETRA